MHTSYPETLSLTPHTELRQYINTTPLSEGASITPNGLPIAIKDEGRQVTRTFKARGGVNALLALGNEADQDRSKIHVTASAGSFALAAAYGAAKTGQHLRIYVPETTDPAKVAAIHAQGGDTVSVKQIGEAFPDALAAALDYTDHYNGAFLSPFDNISVVAGHTTIVEELAVQTNPNRKLVIGVPVGGGGLLAAIAHETAKRRIDADIVAAQFDTNVSAELSMHNGTTTPIDGEVNAACPGAAVKQIGEIPLKIIKAHEDRISFATVTPPEVGRVIDFHRQRNTANFPETTGMIAEAALWQYALTHDVGDAQLIAIRSGGNRNVAHETALLDAYAAVRW